MSSKKARLVERGRNDMNGGTYELWEDVENGDGIYIDFNPCVFDTLSEETMAFPCDLQHRKVTDWEELDVWYEDATGGKAIRDLGYEPVEDAS